MSWHREWKALEETISEFSDICSEFVSALRVHNSDTLGTIKRVIIPMAKGIVERIHVPEERYKTQLPEPALVLIKELDSQVSPEFGFVSAEVSATHKTATAVAHFASRIRKFIFDFNYLTSDLEGTVVRLTARAFIHLQRLIIADAHIRNKWIAAMEKSEPECEKLGAVHLLLHGIWSFKIDSAGERTDLVIGEPLSDKCLGEVYLAAEGLVLTEWKVATELNYKEKYQEALIQTENYSRGSLAAIELKRYRYLVIVSKDFLSNVPADIDKNGVIYKHINIAVNPSPPSVRARRQSASKSRGLK